MPVRLADFENKPMTMAEVEAMRHGKTLDKGPSKLEEKVEKDKADYHAERAFKAAVWKRDKGLCRACGAKVLRQLELHPKRGEVHHLESRKNRAVRYDTRNGILLCATDHERVERNKLYIRGTAAQMFTVKAKHYLNAECPLEIKPV